MRFRIIRDLVVHAWFEDEPAAVFELRVQFPFEAEQDVALGAPVIRRIPRGVFNHADSNRAEGARAPDGRPRLALVMRGLDGGPIRGSEGNSGHLHE